MKKLTVFIYLACLPFFFSSAYGQNKEGQIIYTETIKFDIDLPEAAKAYADLIPKEQKSKNILFFDETDSIYKPYEGGDDEVIERGEAGGMMTMVIQRPEYQVYKEMNKEMMLTKQEFMGRAFLIDSPFENHNWKISGESKKILDYNCIKATLQDTSKTVVAWFTPQIPVSNGPGSYHKLPGMILELDINEGKRTLLAEKVTLTPNEKGTITKPKKGKKVSRAEYEKIVEEKTKEMEEQMGGSGSFQIQVRN